MEFHNTTVKGLQQEKADFVNLIAGQDGLKIERDGLKVQIDSLNANHQTFIIEKNKELDNRIADVNIASVTQNFWYIKENNIIFSKI